MTYGLCSLIKKTHFSTSEAFTVLRTIESQAPAINNVLFCTSTLTPGSNGSYIKQNEFEYIFRKDCRRL